jgi:hypothetical protein
MVTKSLQPCPKCRSEVDSGGYMDIWFVGCQSCHYQLEYNSEEVIILHNLLSEAAYKKNKTIN